MPRPIGSKRHNEPWMIPRRDDEKYCRGCSSWLSLDSFSKLKSATDGLSYRCRKCISRKHVERREEHNAWMRDWYRRNKDTHLSRSRAWAAANAARVRELRRDFFARNPDYAKLHPTDPEKRKASAARWRQRHPDRVSAANKNCKLRRKKAPGRGVSPERWSEILVEFDHRCAYCLKKTDALAMEHMDPLSRGGPHEPENVVPACQPCNSRKHTKNLIEFASVM